ncbi:hypothetical protein IMG5_201330 [Ichthyophthirius multifiliis]|uniref:Tetratricopeptide repeat protein n=1 Tax=Ichthyophthirius multifiliis TaxID=5932 RepID=G0R5Y7_ICHMU|nr:hypothetical protein IMG5_201330 [Ichthyophthirius multifiliis]EGR27111.1 hypothetical protein IMG5_201330 [Ichthyophthirius multifiliis]|eukprot:XP_004023995.1 hypothetical protein IMG5_201330 [Ichthyophthirius multifiliis]
MSINIQQIYIELLQRKYIIAIQNLQNYFLNILNFKDEKNIFSVQKSIEILCNSGLQLEYAKEMEEAFMCYQKAKQLESSNINALKCLSWLLFQKKCYRESMDSIQRAYQQNNKDFEVLLIMAKNYDQQNQVKQALEYFIKAIQVNDKSYICWCYLGITFFKLNMMKDAFTCFNKSYKLENNIEVLFNIGLLFEIGKSYIEALNIYKQIIMVCPDDYMVVRKKINIERNALNQNQEPLNKKQLNKLKMNLREPPYKPTVKLWLEELDDQGKQKLQEQENQQIQQINNSQQLKQKFSFDPKQTQQQNDNKDIYDSQFNTPGLIAQTPNYKLLGESFAKKIVDVKTHKESLYRNVLDFHKNSFDDIFTRNRNNSISMLIQHSNMKNEEYTHYNYLDDQELIYNFQTENKKNSILYRKNSEDNRIRNNSNASNTNTSPLQKSGNQKGDKSPEFENNLQEKPIKKTKTSINNQQIKSNKNLEFCNKNLIFNKLGIKKQN